MYSQIRNGTPAAISHAYLSFSGLTSTRRRLLLCSERCARDSLGVLVSSPANRNCARADFELVPEFSACKSGTKGQVRLLDAPLCYALTTNLF